ILVNNAGGPPPGDFRNFTHEDWIRALESNMLTPIELIRATIDGMSERGYGRIVNITSSAVKAPIDVLGLSNGARSGLTGFVAGLARSKVAATGVTINNLLPGLF
ncbi:SDR family NAD(P)-dependent oxidoreductase, partial [Klebsiella pneumoniae]|nr:SDR family NAD(P)-dependent oxidoreductase [Klebsiella pneumoniae]